MIQSKQADHSNKPLTYPPARRGDQIDTFHGIVVHDPYRWLEDTKSPETSTWIDAQHTLTNSFINPALQTQFRSQIETLWSHARLGAPWKRGKRVFQFRNNGLQDQDVLYLINESDGEAHVLFDPNALSDEKCKVSLSGLEVTLDGNLMAYGLSRNGSDWVEWRVRDLITGNDRVDCLKWIKYFGVSWMKDNSGFFYSRYDEPTSGDAALGFQKLFFHKLGTPQEEDRIVYEQPDQKNWLFESRTTKDGRYLIITIWTDISGRHRLYIQNIATGQITKLVDKDEAPWWYVDSEDNIFWFRTTLGAPRGRLVAIDIQKSDEHHLDMKEVIPEPAFSTMTLQDVDLIGDQFIARFSQDAQDKLVVISLEGKFVREVMLPGKGTAWVELGAIREDTEMYYAFTNYTTPRTIFHYNISTGESTLYFKPKMDIDPSAYTTELVFAKSKDGTKVPMFISYRKGLQRNGQNPTWLSGYGGFNTSLGPRFCGDTIWMDLGGISAEALLRGGGEYGEEWHKQGMQQNKQNVFNDFIACSEWLIERGYTSSSKLAISGVSNGGLLVGACMTQRPDLFAATLPSVGVMDMLRYHHFNGGALWRAEYGCVEDNEELFKALLAYSPYHNVRQGLQYPATLVSTGLNDDRVAPGHSFKFVAALQNAQADRRTPCLIYIHDSGHGAGTPQSLLYDQLAVRLAFLVQVLGIDPVAA